MNLCKAAYDKIIFYGRQSVTGRFFGAVGRWFDRLCKNSLIISCFSREEGCDFGERSVTGKALGGLWKLGTAPGRHFSAENSGICSYAAATAGDWKTLPIAWLGSLLIPLSITAYTVSGWAAFAAVFLLSLILMLIPCSLGGMVCGSLLVRLLFPTERLGNCGNGKTKAGLYLPPFLFGMICALFSVFCGWIAGCALFAAGCGAVLLLCYPEAGILLLILGAPFLPTMALAGLLIVTFGCYLLSFAGKQTRTFYTDNTGVLLFAFAALLIFFGVTSFTPVKSTEIAALECCFILGYFLCLWLMDTPGKIKGFVFLFVLGALGCGMIGLYQYLSGDVNTTWTDTKLFEGLSLRVYSTFGNPNVYGEYLLLSFPCAAVMCFIDKKPLMKVFYGGTALLLLANLALTYSRGCYLALIFIFFLTVCWGMRQLLIFVPFAILAMPFVLPDSIINRFTSITNFSDHSTSYRLNIWLGTLNMLENFCFLGIGLGQEAFEMIYSRYMLNQIFAPHAHNLFLQVTTETGIAGLLLLLGFLLAFFVSGYIAHRKVKGSRTSWFIVVMMSAVGGYLFEGLFDNVWYNYRVFLIFFLFLAVTGAVGRLVRKENISVFDR